MRSLFAFTIVWFFCKHVLSSDTESQEDIITFKVTNPYFWPVKFYYWDTPFANRNYVHVMMDDKNIPPIEISYVTPFGRAFQILWPYQSISITFHLGMYFDLSIPGIYTVQWVPGNIGKSDSLVNPQLSKASIEFLGNEMNYYPDPNYGERFIPRMYLGDANTLQLTITGKENSDKND